ncbi:MAG: DNA-processing protein DprA [Planctomycetales bacterium]|nr:DNA-processing protein DprA [Planctomycetales bacterium]
MSAPEELAEAWLRLAMPRALEPRFLAEAIAALGGPREVLDAGRRRLREAGVPPKAAAAVASGELADAAAREREECRRLGVSLVPRSDPGYPVALASVRDPPPVLWVRGRLDAADEAAVAIVGSRRATEWGRGTAERLGREVAGAGATVVSGGARGVDAAAHRGALAGGGRTIAVLGNGLRAPYPPEHEALFGEIAGAGAVVTEFPLDEVPRPANFPRRNRVVAGLALGVVVVEATETSGAWHTVGSALEEGREVMAVPGRAGSPTSALPHQLLREGAALVEGVSDILAALPPVLVRQPAPALEGSGNDRPAPSPGEAALLRLLEEDPLPLAEIAARARRPVPEVAAALTRLEIGRRVRALPGGLYAAR